MTVDIYTETTWKGPRRKTGLMAYIVVIRYGSGHEDYTKKRLLRIEDATMQEAELFILALALGAAAGSRRIPAGTDLNVISSNPWVKNMAESNLKTWVANNFKNAKGEDVKHKDWWQAVARVMEGRNVHFIEEHENGSGFDRYQPWLRDQLEKTKAEAV